MAVSKFKVGDIVTPANEQEYFTFGHGYTIENIDGDTIEIRDDDGDLGWGNDYDFELLEKPEPVIVSDTALGRWAL